MVVTDVMVKHGLCARNAWALQLSAGSQCRWRHVEMGCLCLTPEEVLMAQSKYKSIVKSYSLGATSDRTSREHSLTI